MTRLGFGVQRGRSGACRIRDPVPHDLRYIELSEFHAPDLHAASKHHGESRRQFDGSNWATVIGDESPGDRRFAEFLGAQPKAAILPDDDGE